jgi:hypothetical protein
MQAAEHGLNLTSNGQLGATCHKLKEFAAFFGFELAHDLKEVAHASAVKIEAMIGLDRVHECYKTVSFDL